MKASRLRLEAASVARGRSPIGCGSGVETGSRPPCSTLSRVTQETPSWRPMMSSGTMSALVAPESSAKAKVPNATRPVPGRRTGSST